jgi:hypothetical protein
MAETEPRDDRKRETVDERAVDEKEPNRLGDVLGLSDAPPDVDIPRATTDRSGSPEGIDVRTPTTGTGDLRRGKGATGIDMGAGGSDTDIEPTRPRSATDPED